jgi:hypothetical protein
MQINEIIRKILIDIDNKKLEIDIIQKRIENLKSTISNYVVESQKIEYNILFDYKNQVDMETNKINVLKEEITILKNESIKLINGV